eukprot:scaffold478_cov80-Skeletonema_marinoi.AAC.2
MSGREGHAGPCLKRSVLDDNGKLSWCWKVELSKDGKSGRLVDVLRSTNTVDTVHAGTIQGGRDYTGAERSDVHGVIFVSRK